MAVELQRMPKLISLLGKFDKGAVLTDTAWLRTAAEVEGAIIPSLVIKSFARNGINAAEAWLDDKVPQDESDDADFENMPL